MSDSTAGSRTFFSELKRRRVFRVAAVYAAVAFAIAQVADIFFPGLGLPEWSLRLVLVLLILGFPVALVLAWAFELTPEGVMRTDAADAGPDVPERGTAALPVPSTPGPVRVGRIAVAGAGLAFALAGGRGETSDLSPNRVAVDAFVNRTGNPALDAAGHMAADWLVDGLQQIGGLEVVPAVSLGTPALASAAPGAEAARNRIAMLASAHHLLGEHERELQVVRAGQTHFADDLPLRGSELRALAALGRTQEVLDRLDEAFTLRGDVPTALHTLALELTTHGHANAAAQVLERSVAWQRARPASEAGTPNARFRLGRDLLELGQTAEARRIFEALVQEAPEELSTAPTGALPRQARATALPRRKR